MEELVLFEQGLTKVPDDYVSRGASVTTLNLGGNSIRPEPGSNLDKFPKVETLILDSNGLETLEGFPVMPSVHTLWLNKNLLDDLTRTLEQVKRLFPSIKYLSLMGNPCGAPLVLLSEEDVGKTSRYRAYVAHKLGPQLTFLDASPVTEDERKRGREGGELLAPRKPITDRSAAEARAASAAAEASAGSGASSSESRKPNAFLGLGNGGSYDGKHSEGNRFIVDSHL